MDSPGHICGAETLLGMYIIVVLCLIVIAMSEYKMAYGMSSSFDPTSLAYVSQRSDVEGSSNFVGSGAMEAPAFWNMGSAQATAAALAQAAAQNAADAAAHGGVLSDESFHGGRSYMYSNIGKIDNLPGA